MSKKSYLREAFDKQYGKRAQGLLKSTSQHLCPIHWSLSSQLSWKKFPLLTSQIFGPLFNTLPTGEKYPLLKRDNLTIPIQMQLSHKQKNFSEFFAAFLKSRWDEILNILKKKMALSEFLISKLRTPKT